MKRQIAAAGVLWLATIAMTGCSHPAASGISLDEAFKPLISPSTTVYGRRRSRSAKSLSDLREV